MRIVGVDTCEFEGRTDIFHYYMFHGNAYRDDAGPMDAASHDFRGDYSRPVLLDRNGWWIPPVFRPCPALIVREDVKNALAGFQSIDFVPVQFRKLISLEYKVGDFSYYQWPDFRRNPMRFGADTIIDRFPDVPELHDKVGQFYEMVIPVLCLISEPGTLDRELHWYRSTPQDHDACHIRVSLELFKKYPVLYDGPILFHEAAFEKIEEFFDWDFFCKKEFDI